MSDSIFKLKSKYSPAWDQGKAINEILKYLNQGAAWQTLWWVTWSWKTFTMAKIIEEIKKPTLIIAHNKTLAAQLAQEFKEFFPESAVHYFVSYYDYYQPEAYVSKTDTYIEKEATINEEIDRLRHAATQDLLTRKDVIIVASVSCIYGIWDISLYTEQIFDIEKWKEYNLEDLLKRLINIQYKRAGHDFTPGTFRVYGDTLEIFPASMNSVYTIEFWWNEVTDIKRRNHLTWEVYETLEKIDIFPAKHTVTTKDRIEKIVPSIKKELNERLEFFNDKKDIVKAERLKTKVEYDMEMMLEVWYVNWIENYSRYLDWRKQWESPYTLIDYFWDDFLCFIDESHMTIPQIGAMYAWDRSRKDNLIQNGFRLPSALDNRPLKFEEFENKLKQTIAVSATPWTYEINQSCARLSGNNLEEWYCTTEIDSAGLDFMNFNPIKDWNWESSDDCRIIPKIIRPTWLLDPEIEIKPMEYMIDDIMKSIEEIVERGERMLITTVTKKSSEELTDYLLDNWVKVNYLHSEVDTLDRLEILKDLREWTIDVIVWVNLLREWLDLPEVSRIAIIDADKQWFLRSESALIQIIWRAARNSNWKVNMYVEKENNLSFKDEPEKLLESNTYLWKLYKLSTWKTVNEDGFHISEAMKKSIELTYYRRQLQKEYNKKNNITPKTVFSSIKDMWISKKDKLEEEFRALDAIEDRRTLIWKLELEMDLAATNMEYEKAADIRDQIIELKRIRDE